MKKLLVLMIGMLVHSSFASWRRGQQDLYFHLRMVSRPVNAGWRGFYLF